MRIFGQLADDEFGSVDTMGYILMVTLLAIGGITGLTTLRDGIIQEGGDIFNALRSLDQSFSIWVPNGNGQVTWTHDGADPPVYNDPSNATNIFYVDTEVPGSSPANGVILTGGPGSGEGSPPPTLIAPSVYEPLATPGENSPVPGFVTPSPFTNSAFLAPSPLREAGPAPTPGP